MQQKPLFDIENLAPPKPSNTKRPQFVIFYEHDGLKWYFWKSTSDSLTFLRADKLGRCKPKRYTYHGVKNRCKELNNNNNSRTRQGEKADVLCFFELYIEQEGDE